MYFMGETKLPEGLLPPPDVRTWQERGAANRAQFGELVASNFRDQQYVQASNNLYEARIAAYDKRIADIESATGVKIDRPWNVSLEANAGPQIAKFNEDMAALQKRFPDHAAVIRANEPVDADVMRLQADTAKRVRLADDNAKDLTGVQKLTAAFLGAGAASFRDPVNISTMAVKGEVFAAKTIYGKIVQQAVTEGALNGGAEAVVQLASADAKRKAGLPVDDFWKQVGLAAAFGGGLGGLAEGVGHVLKARGGVTPDTDAALARMAAGDVSEADARLIAEAAGVKVDEGDMASLTRAMEADADTTAVLRPDVDERQLADAVRAIETDAPLPRLLDEVDETHVPPGLRKQPIVNESLTTETAQNIPQNIPDTLAAFVDSENAARLSRLEDFVAMNEADIAHLRDDGALDAMPSERDFSNVRGASDEHRASIVLAELENKVAKTKAEIAAGPKHSVNDAAAQIAYAKQQPQVLVHPELRTSKLATPASTEAVEAAARKLEAAGGAKVKPLDHTSPKAAKELVRRDTLDIMDALPGGTDANGNPISTTHAELSDTAARMNDLADLIASCKA
jgi:hypothetical protein